MLKICTDFSGLDFERLCRIYGYDCAQQNRFYDYLREDFFRTKDAFYAVWVVADEYVSALRMEPFEDGYLLEAIQTVKTARRKGYAKSLLEAVLNSRFFANALPVYAHIFKNNHASMELHRVCGFRQYLDYAAFIDGTVSANACTVIWKK